MRFCEDYGIFQSELLLSLPWCEHGFGTRHDPSWPGAYTGLRQVHSNLIWDAGEVESGVSEGDALATGQPGTWVGVRTADCLPLLLADTRNRVVVAVHAGWRGTVARIAFKAVITMKARYGTNPSELIGVLGPGILECCFEVGPEVAAAFREYWPDAASRRHIDLAEVNYRQLVEAGVTAKNIDHAGLCTCCRPVDFESFRRDRDRSGRMVSAIRVRAERSLRE